MRLRRARADEKRRRDLRAGLALRRQLKHQPLAIRQRLVDIQVRRARMLHITRQRALRQGRTQVAASARDSSHGLHEIDRRAILQNVAARAVAESLHHIRLVCVHGENDDLGLRMVPPQLPHDLQPVQPRDHQVKQHDGGLLLLHQLHRLQSIRRLTHQLEILLGGQHQFEALSHHVMIFRQRNGYHIPPPASTDVDSFSLNGNSTVRHVP